jgi:Protein of unknown function (DUF2851)
MNNQRGNDGGDVAEIQGLYGPFSFPEKLLQQIWLRCDFDQARACTTDGRRVRILHPGRWNRLGGPDFKQARLEIGGVAVCGDVELHLRAADWAAHGHASDPAYDNVVLHVILFPTAERATRGAGGRALPILPLLSLLNHDLEEYAADEAIERMADHPLAQARRELTQLSVDALRTELLRCSGLRWNQKVHFAKLRVARLGWEEACHHTALEIFGYRFNRAPMLAVAAAHPLTEWGSAGPDFADAVYREFGDRWNKQGSRPANLPRARLLQYASWLSARPDWPARLHALAAGLPSLDLASADQIAAVRRTHRWPEMTRRIAHEIFGDTVGGTRLHTLICDGLLPLLASREPRRDLSGLWFAWPPGDIPAKFGRLLRELGATDRQRPLGHGIAQGLLGWLLTNEVNAAHSCPTPAGRGA